MLCRWYSKTLIISVHLAGKWIESEAAPQRTTRGGRQSVSSSSSRRWKWDGDVHLFIDFLSEQLESLSGILDHKCCWGGNVTHADFHIYLIEQIIKMHECYRRLCQDILFFLKITVVINTSSMCCPVQGCNFNQNFIWMWKKLII